MFPLGIGALMPLVKSKKHFVGLTWDDPAGGMTEGRELRDHGRQEPKGPVGGRPLISLNQRVQLIETDADDSFSVHRSRK
jgi:hypothetical protein